MEDSLNDVPDEDEEDPYAYEEDFEADDYEAEEANDSEEEVEFRDRKSSTWKEGVTSPKSTPWKSVARTYDQTPTSTISTISPSPSTKAGKGATAISPAPVSSTLIDVDAHETKSKNNHHLQKVESSHTPRQDSSETVKSPSKGDLAEAIALRLASMSEEQQRQLLQMLNLVDHAPNVRQSIEQTKEEPQKDKIHSRDDPSLQIQAPAPKNDAIRISPSITRVSPDISQEQLPVDSDYKSSISTSNHEEPRFETSLAELTTIKIKLHNNWRKTKYSSLASIRLLECGSNRDIDLSNFSSQVWVGNTMLPKSSEVAHSVSLLFARSRVRQHKDWKFPIESGAQLILTGNMSGI